MKEKHEIRSRGKENISTRTAVGTVDVVRGGGRDEVSGELVELGQEGRHGSNNGMGRVMVIGGVKTQGKRW